MSDQLVLLVFDHHLRRRIAKEIVRSADPISLVEISQRLGEPHSSVSYHGQKLSGVEPPAITRAGTAAGPGGPLPLYVASRALADLYPLLVDEDGLPPTRKG